MTPRQFLRAVIDRAARWPLLLAWLALIFALSSIPSTPQPPSEVPYDKLAHLVLYGVLGFLLAWMLGRRAGGGRERVIAIAVALSVAYGVSDEIHQAFVPGRDPSIGDLVADFAGALAGGALAALFRAITEPPRGRA